MKLSPLAILTAISTPVTAEIFFQEKFNDEVSDVLACRIESSGTHV